MLASPAQVRKEIETKLAEMMADKVWVENSSRKIGFYYHQDVSKRHMSFM